jgi:hypothetical protein
MINRIVFSKTWLLVFLICFANIKTEAQCLGCSITITSNAIPAYTINAGQTACIIPGFVYTGTITLNGGVLCNSGVLNNVVFNSGTLNNYGTFVTNSITNVINTGNVTINALSGKMTFKDLNVLATNQSFLFTINLSSNTTISFDNLSCSKGSLIINNNGKKATGQSIVNVGQALSITNTGDFNLTNLDGGVFNVAQNINLDDKGNKIINNSGSINAAQSFTVGGNGQSVGVVSISNNTGASFNIVNNYMASYSNGTIKLTNNASVVIGNSFINDKDVAVMQNNAEFTIRNDLSIQRGTFTNAHTLSARDIDVKNGTFVNNYITNLSRNFISSNNAAIVNNNGYIQVSGDFNNKGAFNFGRGAALTAKNLYNENSGFINGADSLKNDSLNYAKIIVSNTTSNKGVFQKYVALMDLTLAPGSLTGMDFNQSPAGLKLWYIPFIPCNNVKIFITATQATTPFNPISFPVCKGTNVRLVANGFYTATFTWFIPFFGPITITIPIWPATPFGGVANYNWNVTGGYGTFSGQAIILNNVTTNVTAVVSALFPSSFIGPSYICSASASTLVTVSNLLANAGLDRLIIPTSSTMLGGIPAPFGGTSPSASGGTPPYTYIWLPNTALTPGNTVANPNASPSSSIIYTLTVTDFKNCKDDDDVIITVQNFEYAKLMKALDGSSYSVAPNNKFYFTTDGEYSNVNLNYTVYNFSRTPMTGLTISSSTLDNGDNRYELNVSTLAAGYYVLEVVNQKKEKVMLRFKK